MFTVSLALKGVHRTGLEALDFCRAHGLPDRTVIRNSYVSHPRLECTVDEAFARLWFPPSGDSVQETVTPDMLRPGDLQFAGQTLDFARDDPARWTAERITALYIAARFKTVRARLAQVEAELLECTAASTV